MTEKNAPLPTKEVLVALRKKHGLTQAEMAATCFVTRQAVSRWETGETVPNPETLKLISQTFDISINTLLGSPRSLICQCCGMPLQDHIISREPDGTFNEDYCKWCYAEGEFVYSSLTELIDFLAVQMASQEWPEEKVHAYLQDYLPQLKHWQKQNESEK